MSKPVRLAIAITTHNSAAYIADLLSYVVGLDAYRVYVLDDASTDDTVTICRRFAGVEVLAGNKNVGPTRNRNRILGKDIGDVLVFLDDDMAWRTGDLVATVRQYFEDPELGALGFGIYSLKNEEIWFRNELESNPLFFWARRPFIRPMPLVDRKRPFFYVQWLLEGACAFRSDLFTSLRGFDERFKRYQEGPDICRRIRQKDLRIGYTNDVQFTHTKPLSVFKLSHAGKFIHSGIKWHVKHRGKIKPAQPL